MNDSFDIYYSYKCGVDTHMSQLRTQVCGLTSQQTALTRQQLTIVRYSTPTVLTSAAGVAALVDSRIQR